MGEAAERVSIRAGIPVEPAPTDVPPARTLLRRVGRVARPLVGLALFGVVAYGAARDWQEVSDTLARMSPLGLVGSTVLSAAGLFASVLVWRLALRELGAGLGAGPSARIYLVGQLGKYIPGSLWALVIQMELARRAGVSRARTLAASIVAILVNLTTGVAIGIGAVPALGGGNAWHYTIVAILILGCAATLNPPVLGWLLHKGSRVLRQPPLQARVRWRGIAAASSWSLGSWLAYGVSLWVLVVLAGGSPAQALPLCLSGIALAMTAGFLFVVAPSGIGVREAVIVGVLAPVLAHGPALAVALVLRLISTVVDLGAAGISSTFRIRKAVPVRD